MGIYVHRVVTARWAGQLPWRPLWLLGYIATQYIRDDLHPRGERREGAELTDEDLTFSVPADVLIAAYGCQRHAPPEDVAAAKRWLRRDVERLVALGALQTLETARYGTTGRYQVLLRPRVAAQRAEIEPPGIF